MKKITLKISAFLLLTMFALQVQGQELPPLDSDGYGFWNAMSLGSWKIKLKDDVSGETLFLTVDGATGQPVWSVELPGDDPAQVWIYENYDAGGGSYTISTSVAALAGQVLQADQTGTGLTPNLILGAPGAQDEWQMRKFANVEPDYTSNGQLPGQNAILLLSDKAGTPWAAAPNAVRFGTPPAKDAVIKLDQSAYALRFKFIAPPLSNDEFDTSSIFISNPVNNELKINGLSSNVKQVSVFSLLGQEVLTRKVDTQSSLTIDTSALTSGMYLVELSGDNGRFSQKIVKQ